MTIDYQVRNAKPEEFNEIGRLMVDVYSQLEGFPKQEEQPKYYDLLRNVGGLTKNQNIELLVAVSKIDEIGGAVVYYNDMKDYGSGGSATLEKNACGFRLLAVPIHSRGKGIGKLLTNHCIGKGQRSMAETMVIHTTKAMQRAWKMYEGMGFERAIDLDFIQGELPVFGFRQKLENQIK